MSRHDPAAETIGATEISVGELPEVLQRVAEACGVAAALGLAGAFGGREVYIPRPEAIGDDHPLAAALGLACAQKAAKTLGHGDLHIPLGPASTPQRRRHAIRALKLQRKSHSYIARALGIDQRTVERRVAAERLGGGEDDQPGLFD